MRCVGQPTHRSVHRGKTRLCIELGDTARSVRTRLNYGSSRVWIRGQGAPAQAGGKLRMKVSYEVRPSQSPWLRVMRLVGQPTGRSVHRGTTGPCIELRNHFFVGPTLSCQGEGNSVVERQRRVRCHPHGVRGHAHGRKLFSRKLGDPRNIRFVWDGSVGEGEMPQVRHVRSWEVRQSHSTCEAGEQSRTDNGSGVRGGNGTDQGERQTVVIGPDTGPGFQIARTVWRTSNDSTGSGRLEPVGTTLVIIQGKSRMQ